MAKKRTRAQKLQARNRYMYHYDEPELVVDKINKPITGAVRIGQEGETALLVPTNMVVRDLGRTILLSIIVLGIEFLLYWYWR